MMLRLTIICIIVVCLITCSFVFCEEEQWMNEPHMEHSSDLVDPFSFNYDRSRKRTVFDKQTSFDTSQQSPKLTNVVQDCKMQESFYKRLIMMLLSNAVLEEKEDIVEGSIYIRGTVDQLETLKKFGDGHYKLNEIDALLSTLLQKPTKNYVYHMNTVFNILLNIKKIIQNNQEATMMVIASLCFIMIIRKLSMSLMLFISGTIIAIFIVSYFMTWWQLIQEAEIKLAAIQMKYLEMPKACQPHNMDIWDKMKSLIFTHDMKECEKYYEARMSDPKIQVTPVLVLVHMVSSTLLHPISHLGHAISTFIENSTGHLQWMKGPVQIILYVGLLAIFIVIIISIKGGSIGFGFGPFYSLFNIDNSTKNNRSIKMLRKPIEELNNVSYNALPAITNKDKNDKNNDSRKETRMLELNPEESISSGSGDTAANNMCWKEINETGKKLEKDKTEINKESDIGGGGDGGFAKP